MCVCVCVCVYMCVYRMLEYNSSQQIRQSLNEASVNTVYNSINEKRLTNLAT